MNPNAHQNTAAVVVAALESGNVAHARETVMVYARAADRLAAPGVARVLRRRLAQTMTGLIDAYVAATALRASYAATVAELGADAPAARGAAQIAAGASVAVQAAAEAVNAAIASVTIGRPVARVKDEAAQQISA